MLCPVRALKIYFQMTDKIRQNRKNLILSIKKGQTTDIVKSTISSLLKRTIQEAYSMAEVPVKEARAHEVRAVTASWAYYKNMAMEDLLKACSWKSQNTFTKHYLRNMALDQEGRCRFGPTVGLQQNL